MKRTNFTFSFGSMALGGFLLFCCFGLNLNSLKAQDCMSNGDLNWQGGTLSDATVYADPSLVVLPTAISPVDDLAGTCVKTVVTVGTPVNDPTPSGCTVYQSIISYQATEADGSTDMIDGQKTVSIDPSLCTVAFAGDGDLGDFQCSDGAPAAPTATDCLGAVTPTVVGTPTMSGTMASGGITVTTMYTATATNGCTTTTMTTSQTYRLVDNVGPTAACLASPVTVNLDGVTPGGATAVAVADIDNGSADACPGAVVTIDVTEVSCTDVGTVTVTLTITDEGGNTDMCTTDLTVVDNTNPTAKCKDAVVQLDATGNGTLMASAVDDDSFDACGIASLAIAPSAFTCADLGMQSVTLTVTDNNALTATASCMVDVKDEVDPMISCAGLDADVNLDASCMIALPDLTGTAGTDNCGTPTTTQSPAAGNVASAHAMTHTITLTATDGSGNEATCDVTITGKDVTNPTLTTCPADRDVDLNGDCELVVPGLCADAVFADNCTVVCSMSPASGDALASAHNMTHSVTVTGTDGAGNTVDCTVTLTAKDVTAPSITCEATHTVTLDAAGSYTVANTKAAIEAEYLSAFVDNCSDATLTATMLNYSCAQFTASPITVTITADDGINPPVDCDVMVTVEETPPAVIGCPAATITGTASDALCTVAATWTEPTIGQCSYGLTHDSRTHAPGDLFPVGTTTVTYTYVSATGPDLTCAFDVQITEATAAAPQLSCAALSTFGVDANTDAGICTSTSVGALNPPMTADNCANTTLTLSWSTTGATTLTGSNMSMPGAAMPDGIAAGTLFNLGTTTVTYTLSDSDTPPNSTTCMFDVNIIDAEAPMAICQDFTAELDAAGMVTVTAANFDNGSTDNCGVDLPASSVVPSMFTCADVGAPIAVVVTIMDVNGNDAQCNQMVTIEDKAAPVVTGTIDMTTVEGCDASAAPVAATDVAGLEALASITGIEDNCTADAMIAVTSADVESGSCPLTITRKYTLTDAAGNASEVEHVIKVDDTVAPTITCPANTTIECDLDTTPDDPVTVSIGFEEFPNTNPFNGNEYAAQGVTFVAPNGTRMMTSLSCGAIANTGSAALTNFSCGGMFDGYSPIEINFVEAVCEFSIQLVTNNTDDVEVLVQCLSDGVVVDQQIVITGYPVYTPYSVVGGTAFDQVVLTPVGPSNGALVFDDLQFTTCGLESATAVDACTPEADIDISYTDVTTQTANGCGNYMYTINRTWIATDDCLNTSTCAQTIEVEDTKAPVITCVAQTTPIDCPAAPVWVDATATDLCDAAPVVSFTDAFVAGACAGTGDHTRTWTATDACGNASTCSATITVQDVTPPTITCVAQTTPIDCPAAPVWVDATATDLCDAAPVVSFTDAFVAGACAGTGDHTRTWTATDACGNASTCSATITVQDVTPPTITCVAQTTPIDCPAAPVWVDATATDLCDAAPVVSYTDAFVAGACAGTGDHTRTWTATDACGNASTCSATITVQDVTPPTITCVAQTTPIDCPAAPVWVDATVTDLCDAAPVVSFTDAFVAGACAGTGDHTRTWTATDACGNASTCSATITVQDVTPPTLIGAPVVGTNNIDACMADALALAATQFDAVKAAAAYTDACGTVTAVGATKSITGSNCAWVITHTFNIVDECNNVLALQTYADQGSDKTAPTGMAPAGTDFDGCLSENTTLSVFDADAIAALYTDNCMPTALTANNITMVSREVTGDDCGWAVKYTYNVADDCWNAMLTQTYTDTGSDKEAPAGDAPAGSTGINACFADALTAAPFDATVAAAGYTDNCGTAVTATLVSSTPAGDDCAWTVMHVYDVVDACGNTLAGESYIDSGSDQTAPAGNAPAAITGINDCAADALANNPFDAAYAVAGYTDNCGSTVTAIETASAFSPSDDCAWTITYTYEVVDACGNKLEGETYTVSGSDQTAPTGTAPAAITGINDCAADALANNPFDAAYAVAGYSDNCGAPVTAVETASALAPSDDCAWTITYTYEVVDACGNKLEGETYTVSGADTDAPTGTAPAGSTLVDACFADAVTFDAAAVALNYTDDCNTATVTNVVSTPSGDDCSWMVVHTYDVVDACGNTLVGETYTDSGSDQTDPTPTCNNITITLDAGVGTHTLTQAEIDAIAAGSSDNCGAPVTWSVSNDFFDCASTSTNPNTVTLTVVDACGNDATCDAEITVLVGDNQPMAVCSNIDVTLDANGNYTVTAPEVDGGSTGCGNLTLTLTGNVNFDCSHVGPNNTVTLTVSDAAGNSDECTAQIDVIASAVCFPAISGGYGNSGGPMIADPCTCRGNGEFDEEVHLKSNSSGQEWTIISVTGLAPWANGQLISDLGNNEYSAVGIHLDGVGYSIEVESRFFPDFVLKASNTCFYPDPVINNDLSTICLNTPAIILDGDAGLQSDGMTPVVGTDGFTINGTTATRLDAMALGVGTHTVVYCFDAGTPLGFTLVDQGLGAGFQVVGPPDGAIDLAGAMDDPGCEECVTQIINIVETPDVLACNDVQVSLDENCEANINPDMILEGTYLCFDDYSVQITTAAGSVVANPVGPQYWGQELTATVTHLVSGNSCWGKVIVEDKLGPEFTCSAQLRDKMGNVIQSGTVFSITCDIDPASISVPRSNDNCDRNVAEYLISETITGDECDVLTLKRVYGAEDSHGNAGNTCEITINITQPTVTFPEDIAWTCEQYAAYSNIINPTELNLLINPANASDLDPNWDDTRDNCVSRNESDANECLANFAGTYVDCVVDPNAHVLEFTQSPTFPNGVAGLEDADVLEITGSGVPSVFEKDACKFTTTWEDQLLTACDGVSTDITFKILRTWTVLNWCTGQVSTDVQVIKVTDEVAPVINTDDLTTEFNADKYSDGDAHAACASSGPLDVPTFTDNCSGVDYSSIRVYTPVGEGVAQYDGAGNVIGFSIPAPYLTAGSHTITYEVTDNCGNKTTADVSITIIDGIPPVAICREFTQVALSSLIGGTTAVQAEDFDEASYDNCAPVHFLVRKMDSGDNCDGFTEHNRFRPEVHFCCDNIGDTINVILKVYDRDPGDSQSTNGLPNNSNECMIRVLVEDKSRPECDAPEDVWTTCDEVADNLDLTDIDALAAKWGTATTRDNCGADAEESAPIVDMDLCGVGTVTRNWVARDAAGNRSLGRCQQVIMIMAKNSYKINIPNDFAAECDVASPDSLTYEEFGCDLLAINLEEQDFPASPDGECKKVIRTWRVINWCEYDGASQPIELPRADLDVDGNIVRTNFDKGDMYTSNGSSMNRSDGNLSLASTGYYEYKQHVKIFDNTAPDVSYDGDTQFCGGDRDEDPCTGVVDLPINASDLCTNTTTSWELSAFSDSFVSADFQGNGTLSGRYPLGTHTVRYYVEDECRNISHLDITFEIIDCKAPTPVCFNGLSVSLMPTGMVSVWASDIDASSFDYCHPIKLAANVVTDMNSDGFYNADDYLTTPPTTTEVMLDCNHVGAPTMIQLWVGEVSSDDVNNWDYCVTFIDVQDNLGACSGSKVALGGKITNEEGESVQDVRIDVNNGMSAMTSADGQFNFAIPTGSDITVTPMKNDDVTNGVSTFDLLLISKHILNVERLDSPFKMIAADANNSGNISTLDLIQIRKVILRVSNEFTNNTSWRFVDKKYAFQDANNPLNENFAEAMSMNNMNADELNANFTAIKIGDVNGDATPNSILGVDGRTFNGNMILKASEQNVKAGEEFTVTFTAAQDVQGYQFTLDYDEKAVELVTIENGLTNDNNFNVVNNQIATSWNENVSTKDQEMFSLVFIARADVQVSNILSVNSAITTAEAYGTNGEMMNISLDFGQGATATTFELMQNNPNPFDYETTIGFTLPEASSATMTISDVSGKVLRVIEGDYAKGYNEVKLQRTSDLPTGVLIYELETPTNKATRKMTAVK